MERLEEHARSLALAQAVTPKVAKGNPLAGRLANNETVLLHAYRTIANAISEERAITPAAEWLIDNYHVVERQIRDIRSDLPADYYRQLPKLAEGPFAGYPRVLGVAWAFVAHTDSRFDPEILVRYVRAYQDVQPLTIGELWAVAITLRIVLVENLGGWRSGWCTVAPHVRKPTISLTDCWALADTRPSRCRWCSRATGAPSSQTHSRFNSCIDCATRICGSCLP